MALDGEARGSGLLHGGYRGHMIYPKSPLGDALGPDPMWRQGADAVLLETAFHAKKPGGSMGGFVGILPSGQRLLVKEALSERHAACETLANCLYRALGVYCPDVRWGYFQGEPVTLSPWVDGYVGIGKQLDQLTASDLRRITEFFPADVWLANWDTIGMVYDNLLIDPHASGAKRFLHIDTGGALLFRAQGQSKGSAFGPSASEYESFTVPGKGSKSAFKVFGEIAQVRERPALMLPMMRRILRLVETHYVDRAARWAGFDADEARSLNEIMGQRARDLASRILHDR